MRAAILASGLRSESRIIQKLTGYKTDEQTLILSEICDRLGLFIWGYGGGKGDRPRSIREAYIPKEETFSFDSHTDFEKWRAEFYGG